LLALQGEEGDEVDEVDDHMRALDEILRAKLSSTDDPVVQEEASRDGFGGGSRTQKPTFQMFAWRSGSRDPSRCVSLFLCNLLVLEAPSARFWTSFATRSGV
jgi:hypothetical protein